MEVNNTPTTSIQQFLIDRGWQSYGQCGCQPPKNIYQHPSNPDVVIWANNAQMEIRRVNTMNNRDSRIERAAGVANYVYVYNNYFA